MKIIDGITYCDGPIVEECEKCKILAECSENKLKYYSRTPHVILDLYLERLSGSALKVFLYLNKIADFNQFSNNFGKCWATYDQINDATGVSVNHMKKYLRQLAELGLIEWQQTRKSGEDGVVTINHFKVTWYKRFKDLNVKI